MIVNPPYFVTEARTSYRSNHVWMETLGLETCAHNVDDGQNLTAKQSVVPFHASNDGGLHVRIRAFGNIVRGPGLPIELGNLMQFGEIKIPNAVSNISGGGPSVWRLIWHIRGNNILSVGWAWRRVMSQPFAYKPSALVIIVVQKCCQVSRMPPVGIPDITKDDFVAEEFLLFFWDWEAVIVALEKSRLISRFIFKGQGVSVDVSRCKVGRFNVISRSFADAIGDGLQGIAASSAFHTQMSCICHYGYF